MDSVMLRAMQEELVALNKEASLEKEAFPVAAIGKALGTVGTKVIGGASKGLKALAGRGGRVGDLAQKARGQVAKGVGAGVKRFGAQNFRRGVGAAALGAGALGTAGVVGAVRGRRDR